jgi:cytidylate kinase
MKKINKTNFTRIVIISGSPGTGKTTISRMLAENSIYDKAVHIEVDDFWQCIRKGYINPWLNNSGEQNETVVESVAVSAKRYSKSGYEVWVAGTIGPWFLKPWIRMAENGIDVRYIVLRPNKETTVIRATERQQREFFPLNAEIIENLWISFTNLGKYESHVLDTTGQTIDESVMAIQKMLLENNFRIV